MDIPAARRLERPTWINARTTLGVILFVVALLAGQRVLVAGDVTTPIWRASRDLPAGVALRAADLAPAEVRLPDNLTAIYAGTANDLSGLVLTRAVGAGEIIPVASVVQPSSSDASAMTIPVTPEHAVGGALRSGDTVDVYVSYNAGDVRALTKLVLDDAQILDLVTAGGLVVGDEAVVGVTVSVDSAVAKELAFAIRNGEIDLSRGTTAQPGAAP
ncbi:MAG TPA: RcpC/CpaB family pilus assembly protein [Actinomycetota bacterium]|nr:RcpC/CpaB family pilus assembly protein [Actinomycetota bacterium]